MKRIVIGISSDTSFLERSIGYRGLEINYSPKVFADAVWATGGLPYLIPMHAADYAQDLLDILDGLILIGGHDVSPQFYQEEAHPKLGAIKKERDDQDRRLFEIFYKAQRPILGICRGLQLINVLMGVVSTKT